jgi:inorganic pyrophosphatase
VSLACEQSSAARCSLLQVRHQFRTIPGLMEGTARPNYERCIAICTKSSLREMIAPGALVMLSPIACGVLFGTHTLAGLLAGALVSGVQVAIRCACRMRADNRM